MKNTDTKTFINYICVQCFKKEDGVFERIRSSEAFKFKLILRGKMELHRSRFYVKGMERKRAFQIEELKIGIVVRIQTVRKAMGSHYILINHSCDENDCLGLKWGQSFHFHLTSQEHWKQGSNTKAVLRDFEEKLCEHAQLLSLLFIWNSSKNTVVSPWAKLVYLRSLSPLKNALKIKCSPSLLGIWLAAQLTELQVIRRDCSLLF